MMSQSAYCLSRENRILDEKNDKQQIILRNFPLIKPLASLPVQNKCHRHVKLFQNIYFGQAVMQGVLYISGKLLSDICCLSGFFCPGSYFHVRDRP